MGAIGYQEDGSYVPCPECWYVPEPERTDLPGRSIGPRFTEYHRGGCPKVSMPREVREQMQAKFREWDECRGRAEVASRSAWIG